MNKLDEIIRGQLGHTLTGTNFSSLGKKYEGKVRDCYTTSDAKRIIIVSDRISAFDVVLGTIPFKGQVLNQIARYWFEETARVAPNHVISVPDPNVMIARECTLLPVEFVMRAYLTGVTTTSIWHAYERGAREFCGHKLPERMKKHQRLPCPLLTPSTKAEKGGHDVSVSRNELLDTGVITAADFEKAAQIAAALFSFGERRAAERGLILVDTKYEMGKTPDGEIIVIDEIHTPDSSRYWFSSDYEARIARGEDPRGLDKEYVRKWLATEQGYLGDGPPPPLPDDVRIEAARRYISIYELVTGHSFVPDVGDPIARMAKNLGISA
ncbi:MAG: phosphoribosylaminoimidazolesuccinocarboxamide synthase [Deltaproteobacteria bacterium]|nr:phosphoribosylaminoimidazolesuccinocarboxamide synthase [Deltaproteobacteria bacterium]